MNAGRARLIAPWPFGDNVYPLGNSNEDEDAY